MEKISLPIKTKIAAWWIMTIGMVVILVGFWLLFLSPHIYKGWVGGGTMIGVLLIVLIAILLIFSGYSIFNSSYTLLKRKKQAWKTNLLWILLGIILVLGLNTYSIYDEIVYRHVRFDIWKILDEFIFSIIFASPFLIPLILLLLDRKNFWKIAA